MSKPKFFVTDVFVGGSVVDVAEGIWHQPGARMKYCPECANALVLKRIDGLDRLSCTSANCGFVYWDNPVPVVAALIQYHDKIVIARNALWPENEFSLVTGYLEKNEMPESAAVREVKEETGLDGNVRDLVGCYSLFQKNQIILAYWVVATGTLDINAVDLSIVPVFSCRPQITILVKCSNAKDFRISR